MRHHRLFIGGELVDAASGATFQSVDPGTGEPIATIASAGEVEVNDAVAAARRAFDSGEWRDLSPADRAARVMELADLLQANLAEIALLEAMDSGGLAARAASDVFQAARFLRAVALHAAHDFPWTERVPGKNPLFPAVNTIRREPIGVCAAIIPWNFPLLMAIWKIGLALVTGNTVVLKPSPETPLSALMLAGLIQRSRIPRGVVNVIVSPGGEAGKLLTHHPGVDRIAFTGSTATGKEVMKSAADTVKRVSLELGGKSANIVLEDADLDLAVDGALYAAFLHSGQMCESGSRLLLPESLHDTFIERLATRARQMQVGYQLDPRARLGPVINAAQKGRILRYIELGKHEGARLVTGGGAADVPGFAGGHYVEPTIFAGVEAWMAIAQEEIFGPVLAVLRYRTEDEAVAVANESRYGLAGGVWSRDLDRAEKIAGRLRAGTVWVNDWHVLHEHAPFGGYKESGVGREGGYGMIDYTEVKHVHVGTQPDPNAKLAHRMLVKRPRSLTFDYEPTTRVLSGPGSLARLRSELADLSVERVLVITDPGVVRAGLLERLREVLGSRIAAVFDDVPQDSGLDVIDRAAALGRSCAAGAVVSLGGGSVIDTAKGVAAALSGDHRAIEIIGVHHLTRPTLLHIAVPTTAGTGSEVTSAAVIKDRALRVKLYIVDRHVAPSIAVLDPTLITGLPPLITAATGMDALTHAIEAYTGKQSSPMSDAQALHAVRLIAENLPRSVKQGSDLEARSAMQSAATLAGWAINGSGIGLVHGMSHAIGARHGVPHGIGNGILLPHVLRYNAGLRAAEPRLADIARAMGAPLGDGSPQATALAAADAVDALLTACDHPKKLRDAGVPKGDLAACSAAAFVDIVTVTSARRPAHPGEIAAIYESAY